MMILILQPRTDYKKIIIPIYFGAHWSLVVADFVKSELRYYDSMLKENYQCLERILYVYIASYIAVISYIAAMAHFIIISGLI